MLNGECYYKNLIMKSFIEKEENTQVLMLYQGYLYTPNIMIIMIFLMNDTTYREIYNYLSTLQFPKEYDDYQKNQLQTKSNKYFIQHHQLFRHRKNGQP